MSEEKETKITEEKEKLSESKTLLQQMRGADFPGDGKTRIYDALNKDTRVVSSHKWIDDEDEQIIKPVTGLTLTDIDRETIATADSFRASALDRKTRVGRDSNTRILSRRPEVLEDGTGASGKARRAPSGRADGGAAGAGGAAADAARSAAEGMRSVIKELKNVRVADDRRFGRFLRIVGAFLLILLLELAYFGFASHVEKLPGTVKSTQKELELTKEENKLLKEELDTLGDYDSAEELKASWEKLKEKVEKAEAETYY